MNRRNIVPLAFLAVLYGCGGAGGSGSTFSGSGSGSRTSQGGGNLNPQPSPSSTASPIPPTATRFVAIPDFVAKVVRMRRADVNGDLVHLADTATGSSELHPVTIRRHPILPVIYVANSALGNAGTIDAFSVNTANGQLTRLPGHPVASPRLVFSLNPHPSGNFLYVGGIDAARGYSVAGNGALTQIGTDVALTEFNERDGAFSGNGAFLHLPLETGIQTLNIDNGTGAFGAGNFTSVASTDRVQELQNLGQGGLIVGTCAGVSNNNGSYLAFQVNGSGGLSLVNQTPLNFRPAGNALGAQNRLYMGDVPDPVNAFQINPAGGSITPLANQPFFLSSLGGTLRFTPDKSLLYGLPTLSSMGGAVVRGDGSLAKTPNSPTTDNLQHGGFFEVLQF